MNSKERIAKEAFDLFSANGYAATSVRDIAAAVGIKDSSLYNHYRSKQEIFESVIQTYSDSCAKKFFSFYDKSQVPEESLKLFQDPQQIIILGKLLFVSFVTDEESCKLRKLLATEMYHNEIAAKAYANYLREPILWTQMLFHQMITIGYLAPADPQVLAYEYITPIFTLLTEYECGVIQIEDAQDFLERHVTHFFQTFMNHSES